MQNITYNLRDRRKDKKEKESLFQKLHWTLDSLSNNLMAKLWPPQLALRVLQERDNLDQAKKNLEGGECARKLMRTGFNTGKPQPVRILGFRGQPVPRIYYSQSITLPGKM
jgi:hypothetical protein